MSCTYGPFLTRKQAREQELEYYFTGLPCKHGHVGVRNTKSRRCLDCDRSRQAAVRARDPEAYKAYGARLRAKNKDKKRKQDKERHARLRSNPEAWERRKAEARERLVRIKSDPEALARHRTITRESYARLKANPEAWERMKARSRAYWKRHTEQRTPHFVKERLRTRIYQAIAGAGGNKGYSSMDLLGCTVQEVRDHLEAQFLPGMTWDNWSLKGWHIDHIRPCASFDLTDPEQQKECFHYTNLQPLWAEDNLRKSDKWEPATMGA